VRGNAEQSLYHQQRALSLNPNYDLVVVQQGEILTWHGRAEEGIGWILKAMRLNPYHPERFWSHLGRAYFVARRYAEAVDAIKRISAPDAAQLALLAACEARLGELDTARARVGELLARSPPFSFEETLATLHYRHQSDREHHIESLALAGLKR
jgi:adenylate cyclase